MLKPCKLLPDSLHNLAGLFSPACKCGKPNERTSNSKTSCLLHQSPNKLGMVCGFWSTMACRIVKDAALEPLMASLIWWPQAASATFPHQIQTWWKITGNTIQDPWLILDLRHGNKNELGIEFPSFHLALPNQGSSATVLQSWSNLLGARFCSRARMAANQLSILASTFQSWDAQLVIDIISAKFGYKNMRCFTTHIGRNKFWFWASGPA